MPWQKGQSGNPGGLSKGSRRILSDAFIRALARDFEQHGEQVLETLRKNDPATYFRGIIALMPKEVESTVAATVDATAEHIGLTATMELVDRVISTRNI